MNTLLDPGDATANLPVRQALADIAKAAYGANVAQVDDHLIRLRGVTVDITNPAFTFPNLREASTVDAIIILMTELLAPPPPRQLQIRFGITAATWTLEACLVFETDAMARTWLCKETPTGMVSDRKIATKGLQDLAQLALAFTPIR